MERFFLIQDNESNLGLFKYTTDQEADNLIMKIICDHYCADDCSLNKSFKIKEYKFQPLEISGNMLEDGESNEFEIYIEQIGVYNL